MQVRKFTAFGKPGFVSGAFITRQEMTGDTIHDHHAAALFYVFFLEAAGICF